MCQVLSILMLSPQYHPNVGGYERAAERLSTELVKRKHHVTVIAERRDRAWAKDEVREGVLVRRLWCLYRPRLHVLTGLLSFALFLIFQGRRYDIWHVHTYGMHAGLAVGLGFLLRRPVVLKLTSSGQQGIAKALATTRFSRVVTALHRRVDAVVALTKETEQEARTFGFPPERIYVLGNGVDTDEFRPRDGKEREAIKQRLGLDAEHVVIFVGRLSPEKNLKGLLDAWSVASPILGADWQLVLVGEGPQRVSLEKQSTTLGLDAVVNFVGLQPNIAEWMAAAEVYMLTSDREGLSNTLLEAMSTGLPSIATRVSGVSELIELPEAGVTVATGDIGSFAAAIAKLGRDRLMRDRLGLNARSVIEDRYSIAAVAEGHELLYRNLLAGDHA